MIFPDETEEQKKEALERDARKGFGMGRINQPNAMQRDAGVTPGMVYDKGLANEAGRFHNADSENYQAEMGKYAKDSQNRSAAVMWGAKAGQTRLDPATLAYANATDAARQAAGRSQQLELISRMQQQANGQGPSVAADSLRAGLGQAMAGQTAAALSARGGVNPAWQQRQVALQGAGTSAQTNGAIDLARAQEQITARSMLPGLQSQLRAADMGWAAQNQDLSLFNQGAQNERSMAQAGFNQQTGLSNAQQAQQAALANQGFSLQQTGLNDNAYQWATGRQQSLSEADRQAWMQYVAMKTGNDQMLRDMQSKQEAYDAKIYRAQLQSGSDMLGNTVELMKRQSGK
jgi:hypothetical protein